MFKSAWPVGLTYRPSSSVEPQYNRIVFLDADVSFVIMQLSVTNLLSAVAVIPIAIVTWQVTTSVFQTDVHPSSVLMADAVHSI